MSTTAIQPLRALHAIRRLIAEPEDTRHVFTVIESLAGRAPLRVIARLRADATGRRLLERRADILPLLADRQALEALPDGSLGRAYLTFLDREGITPDGLVDASAAGESSHWHDREDDVGYVAKRLRDTHDLWHVLTGYGGDVLGEAALLAFSAAQTTNPGVAVMALATVLRAHDLDFAREVAAAFRAGLRAAWLPAFAFEEALARPLTEVRAELGITPVGPYVRVGTDWTREATSHLTA